MPVFLFTFHAYRSWMPDRPEGYVQRGRGILPTDVKMAALYNDRATESRSEFNEEIQQILIDESLLACEKQVLRIHFAATDPTHLHLLISWKTGKTSKVIRKSLKTSLTRRLNNDCENRTWFSRSGSRKKVNGETHFSFLVQRYLPSHRGWKWSESDGHFQ